MSTSQQAWRQPISYLAAAALLAGIFWRFRGLGTAPFAVDEYYLARSIENVLRTGIPAFSCGGYYMRGLVMQYLAAAGQLGGLSAELAPRVISALCSLISIPAVFILGRRLHGPGVAVLAIVILALSVWEIEMARFGRMYAPFQAVFVWYMVFFLRYTVDCEARALWPMILLSILGPLVWEGGVFLPLVNLLSVFLQRWPGPIPRSDWRYIIACAALFALAILFVTTDFRGYIADSWPPGYSPSLSTATPDSITVLRLPLTGLHRHLWWLALTLVPIGATLYALRWIWRFRSRRFLALGLMVMLIAALAHQFLAVTATGLLLLLTRLATWKDFYARSAIPFHTALILCLAFWLAFGIAHVDWTGASGSAARSSAMLAYQLLRLPDFIGVVVRPWAKAVPHLGLALFLLIAGSMYRAAKYDNVTDYERILLITFLVLLLAASASHPPREETRYVFFLYPLAIIIALTTISRAIAFLAGHGLAAAGITSAIALSGFALSEDFQPHHLLYIDTPTETFRLDMTQDMQSHLVIRDDYRAIARWLKQHESDGRIAINGVHGLDHYYSGFQFFFVDQHDPNFPDWSCRRGTVERWGNYPLLNSIDSLSTAVAANSPAYLVAFGYNIDQIMLSLAALHPRIALTEGNIVVLELQG